MAKLSKAAMDMFNDLKAYKVIATVDRQGKPNVAVKGSLMAIDEGTIVYSELYGKRTKKNLEATKKAAIVAFKGTTTYQAKGTLQGFKTSGDVFDKAAKTVKERFNLDIKNVGIIKVEEVSGGVIRM